MKANQTEINQNKLLAFIYNCQINTMLKFLLFLINYDINFFDRKLISPAHLKPKKKFSGTNALGVSTRFTI